MKSGIPKKLLLIILPAAAVILTAMPCCVVLRFMADPAVGGYHEVCVSGFDPLAWGYAVWGPMMAGCGSVLLVILGIVGAIRGSEGLRGWMLGIALFALVMSLSAILFGGMTVICGVISALLAAESALLFLAGKRR